MPSPRPTLPIELRQAAWTRLWRALLLEPPPEQTPEAEQSPDADDRTDKDGQQRAA